MPLAPGLERPGLPLVGTPVAVTPVTPSAPLFYAGRPTVRVDAALGIAPLTRPATLDWVRLDQTGDPTTSSPAKALKHRYGARVKTGLIEPSETTVTLDNANGQLYRDNPFSAWNGTWGLRTRVRVVLTPADGSGDRTLITGFVAGLPSQWRLESGEVAIPLDDLLTVAAGTPLPLTPLAWAYTQAGFSSYWPMNTSDLAVPDLFGTRDGTLSATVSAGTVPVVPNASGSIVLGGTPDPLTGLGSSLAIGPATWPDTAPRWLVMPIAFPNGIASSGVILAEWNDGTFLIVDSSGVLSTYCKNLLLGRSAPTNIGDGGPHLLVWRVSRSEPGAQVYLDNTLIYTKGSSSYSYSATASMTDTLTFNGTVTTAVQFGHVGFLWETSTVDPTPFFPAWGGWDGDTPGARLGRLCDMAGIAAGDRALAGGTTLLGPAVTESKHFLDAVQEVVSSETGAVFYVNGDGQLTFNGSPGNSPNPVVDYGDREGMVLWESLDTDGSLDRVWNTLQVTPAVGETQTVDDLASRDLYGVLPGPTLNTAASGAAGARSVGHRIVARSGNPRSEIIGVTVAGFLPSTTLAATIDRAPGDAIRVIANPPHASQITQRSLIETVEHDWADGLDWTTHFEVQELVELPIFTWDSAGRGWDKAVWR